LPFIVKSFVIVGGLLLLTAAGLAGDRPDFSGTWQLNRQLSDDPAKILRQEMERRRAAGTMGGAGARGGSMGGRAGSMGGPGGVGSPEDPLAAAERLERVNRGAETIVIEQRGQEIRIRYADGRDRLLVTDGKKHLRESGIGDLQTKAKWKGGDKLLVKSKTEQGRQITETYEYSPHGTRLHVKVTVDGIGDGPSLRFERVYERILDENS
jgi:hypothetical protein